MTRLIKLYSIRRNPSAGRQVYLEPGQTTRTEKWKQGKLVGIVEERPIRIVHSMTPEPDWLFDYEILVVECSACHARFDFSKLESDSLGGEDDEVYSDEVCLVCGRFDCLDETVKIETISQALRRLKTTNAEAYKRLREK